MNNELTTAKQILETHNLESGAKLRRQKVEASNDSSRLECEIDRLRHQLRGKFLNPKGCGRGGGAKSAHQPEDRLPFLTGSYCGHKNSWLYP